MKKKKNKFDNAILCLFLIFSIVMMIGKTIVMTFQPFDNNELVVKYLKYPFVLGGCVFLLFCRITGKREMGNKFNGVISWLFLIFAFVIIISTMIVDTSQPFDNNELVLEYLKYSLFLGILVYMGLSYIGKKFEKGKGQAPCPIYRTSAPSEAKGP